MADEGGEKKLSKSEMKRRAKAEAAAKKKAEKAAARAAKEAAQPKKKKAFADDEEKDPTKYFENRCKSLTQWESAGVNPYPHKFQTTLSLEDFIEQFSALEDGGKSTDATVSIAGRLYSKRASGSN